MKIMKPLSATLLAVTIGLAGCQSKEQRIADYLVSGEKYLEREDFAAARLEYGNVLQLDPNNVPALEAMSRLHEQEQRLPELYKTLTTLLQLDETNIEARQRMANVLASVGQLDKALVEADKLIELAPERADVQVVRASLLYRTDRAEEGRAQAESVLERDPTNAQARLLLASELMKQGQFAEAIALAEPALDKVPGDRMLNGLKIQALNSLGRGDEALAVFAQLAKTSPADATLHKSYANQYLMLGKPQQAESLLRQFADRERSSEANQMLVEYLLVKGDDGSAERQLGIFIKRYPEQTNLQFMLADLYLASARQGEAEALLNTLSTDAPAVTDQLRATNSMAAIAGASGNSEREAALYRKVFERDPQNVAAIIGLAKQDLARGELEKGLNDLRAALSFAANVPELHLAVAQAHEAQSLTELAQDYYTSALKHAGPREPYISEFARFLVGKGDGAYAERLLEKAVEGRVISRRILSLLAQLKLQGGKWEEAQHYADGLEQLDATEGLVIGIRGAAYTGMREYDKGIALFEKAHEIAPEQLRPMATLVATYVKAGKREQAELFLESAITEQPDNVYAYMLRGALHEQAQQFADAERRYRQALEIEPRISELQNRLLKLLVVQDRQEDALAFVRSARVGAAEYAGLAVSEALLLQRMGDTSGAIDVYRTLIKASPNADIAYNNLALLLLEGDSSARQEAIALAERFRTSEIPHFQDTLGWIYLQTGNKIEGLFLLEKAAKVLGTNAEVRYHLGMAYLANNRKLEAKRELEFAVSQEGQTFIGLEQAQQVLKELSEETT